ncbi:uncharacterized protein LOC123258198 [Drosophila ananassae]|uniref:uncharacterized protein LOC123258198 n=1 Tax=Drosophila ananassae TaxID=7217 RepID=UPI001CFFEF94|nr:uncharacterized protein LOC123258198 [Drosophila ananassae]
MKCTQINLNHCEAAHSLLRQAVIDGGTQVVFISEPYRSIPGNGWLSSSCKGAALWSTETAPQDTRTSYEGFIRASIKGVTFYSCYAPPRWDISRFQRMLRSLVSDARGRSPVVIGGDFNAWSPECEAEKWIPKVTGPKWKDKSLDREAFSVALQTHDWTQPSSTTTGVSKRPIEVYSSCL